MQQRKEERPLGELFGDLAEEVSTLVRQEMELARTEMGQKTATLGRDAGFLAAGGAIAYAGFLALVAALILGLAAAGLQGWLSALIVGAVVALVGYFLIRRGMDGLKANDLTPRETIQTLRELGNDRNARQ